MFPARASDDPGGGGSPEAGLILGSVSVSPPEEVDGCPVILVCGSQDVGKSTFNRYLMNQLLNR